MVTGSHCAARGRTTRHREPQDRLDASSEDARICLAARKVRIFHPKSRHACVQLLGTNQSRVAGFRSKYLSSGTINSLPPGKHATLHGLDKAASGSGRSSPARSEDLGGELTFMLWDIAYRRVSDSDMSPTSSGPITETSGPTISGPREPQSGNATMNRMSTMSMGSYNPSTMTINSLPNGGTIGGTIGGATQLSRHSTAGKDPRSRAKSRDYLKQ